MKALCVFLLIQVNDGVTTKANSTATFMDPKLTAANHTMVLPPLNSFSPSIQSYLYGKLLDVPRLYFLQVRKESVFQSQHYSRWQLVCRPSVVFGSFLC
jgi:hypothetical protein